MRIRICDRCKQDVEAGGLKIGIILKVRWERTIGEDWKKWVLGEDHELELCKICFDDFMRLTPITNKQ